MIRINIFLAVLLFTGMAIGTHAQVLSALQVGDTMPDVQITNLLNYPSSSIRFSELRGKAVILDFCNTSCSTCTENMPELMALKKQFDGKVEVIRITRNTQKEVEALYNRSETAFKSKLPIAVSDTTLIKLFPVKLPHHAWIDPNGIIKAITNTRNTVPGNISQLLNGQEIKVTPAAYLESFDRSKPLFAEPRINLDGLIKRYSLVTGFINGIDAKLGFRADPAINVVTRRAFYNMPLPLLLKLAYGGFNNNQFGIPSDNRKVILEVKDPSRFLSPADQSQVVAWEWENYWCYEVQVSPGEAHRLPVIMQEDLCRYFNLDVSVRKRQVNGLALIKVADSKKLISKGGYARVSYNIQTHLYKLENSTAKELVGVLEDIFDQSVIVDQTGLDVNIDLAILKSSDLADVRKTLQAYGLDLVNRMVETDMLVIKDK